MTNKEKLEQIVELMRQLLNDTDKPNENPELWKFVDELCDAENMICRVNRRLEMKSLVDEFNTLSNVVDNR